MLTRPRIALVVVCGWRLPEARACLTSLRLAVGVEDVDVYLYQAQARFSTPDYAPDDEFSAVTGFCRLQERTGRVRAFFAPTDIPTIDYMIEDAYRRLTVDYAAVALFHDDCVFSRGAVRFLQSIDRHFAADPRVVVAQLWGRVDSRRGSDRDLGRLDYEYPGGSVGMRWRDKMSIFNPLWERAQAGGHMVHDRDEYEAMVAGQALTVRPRVTRLRLDLERGYCTPGTIALPNKRPHFTAGFSERVERYDLDPSAHYHYDASEDAAPLARELWNIWDA